MLNSKGYFDKQLLRLAREMNDLWRRRWIRVTLDEPIQRGWRRFYVLTAKAERRPDQDILSALLKIIGSVRYKNSPDFRKKRGRGKRRRFVEVDQPLLELTVGEWDPRCLPEEWRRYFIQVRRCCFRVWQDLLVFANPSVFELKVEPYWVTELTVSDPAVEQRMAEIKAWLWHRNAKYRLDRLNDDSNRWSWEDSPREALLEKIARREMREAMLSPWEVDLAAFERRGRISLSRTNLFSRRSPISRGTPLRTEPVRVRVLPPGPFALP